MNMSVSKIISGYSRGLSIGQIAIKAGTDEDTARKVLSERGFVLVGSDAGKKEKRYVSGAGRG